MRKDAIRCPICGIAAHVSIEEHWTGDRSRPILRVRCPACRDYAVEGIRDTHDSPVFDEAFLAYLNQLGEAESRFLSQSMRQYREGRNDPYLTRDFANQLITDWRLARAILPWYDLQDAALKVIGPGADHRNRLFIVDTSGSRFTMRLHAPGTDYDEIASKVYWLNRLRGDDGIVTLKPVPASEVRLFLAMPGGATLWCMSGLMGRCMTTFRRTN